MLRGGVLAVVVTTGCATTLELPMTAQELEKDGSSEALVAYLTQPDATASVCDPESHGPFLPAYLKMYRQPLVDAFVEGKLAPELFCRCVDLAMRKAPDDDARSFQDAIARGYRKLLVRPELEKNPAEAQRLAVINRLYRERKVRLSAHDDVLQPMLDDLRNAIAAHKLGPTATLLATELLTTADLEQGRWNGKPVDPQTIDALAQANDVATLERFVERLPSEPLRTLAKRQVVHLHVVASPFPEVRANAAAVEQTLIETGRNALALGGQRLVRAWIDLTKAPMRTVVVEQNVWAQTARLTAAAPGRAHESVLPEISLRGMLYAEVASVSQPITVCQPPHALDPSPCIAPEDVSIDHPLAYVDRGARFHFNDSVAMRQVVALAGSDELVLPVKIAGLPAAAIQWTVHFARPDSLALVGNQPGEGGPPLKVQVDATNPQRFVFDVATQGRHYLVVIEQSEVTAYRVISRGAQGYTGSTGYTGSSGSSGGECQNGGEGGAGGPGGDGGPGGNGGEVRVLISCGDRPCPELTQRLGAVVRSEGGAGGAGGSGGPGGSGGSGGPSRSPNTHVDSNGNTITDDPGCSAGSTGPSGPSGSDGSPGPAGYPGTVTFDTANRAAPL